MSATTKVFILATCRNPDLLPATLLVFNTLRVGFPTAEVAVYLNYVPNVQCEKAALEAIEKAKVDHVGVEPEPWESREPTTTHHRWIADLIEREQSPFWICDTDVIFWNAVDANTWRLQGPMFGRHIPQFRCKFANAITRPRLHTSLLYLHPQMIKAKLAAISSSIPDTYCTPAPTIEDLVFPRYTFEDTRFANRRYFYDTCSMLYQAVGGQWFGETPHLAAYDHLNFGTISDLVAPHYPEERWRESHFAIFENPELARGAWKKQNAWYEKHRA